ITAKNHNPGKAPCRCPQHLSTDAVDSWATLRGNEDQARRLHPTPFAAGEALSERGALGEARLHPHRAKHCGKRGVGRRDRAAQTILLIKVSWINSLARACLTTSTRNVGFSR